jgi:hypothetical protein
VVHFFRQVIGVPILSKEVLAQRTNDYQKWVEAFAGNHQIPIQWGEKGVRKEDYVLPWLRRMHDVAALQAAADRLSPLIIQKQIDYWTLILGPKFSRAERNQINLSRFYAIGQIEYCRNFIFKRNFPIHKIFERSCEIGLWRLTANRISELFGVRLHKRMGGKLGTVIDQIEHGHHVFRAYWNNAFLKQYEKFSTLLRNELCSNDLSDFALKKGLQKASGP